MLVGGAVSAAIQLGVTALSGGGYGGADWKISSACAFLLGWQRGLAGNVPYEENNYHKFCDSIINYYRITDTQKLYAILIGIFTQRMTISCSITQPEQKEIFHDLAVSALSAIPSSFLSNKKDFINFVKEKLEDGLEFSEILQEIYRYLVDFGL